MLKRYSHKNNSHKPKQKFRTELCDDSLSFTDCELAILRHAVDETEKIKGREIVNNAEIKHMLSIMEQFLIRKKLICYGGTAINNILPKYAQFYNRDIEIPDYDFFSPTALDDAKELADEFYKEGYLEVEAKSGVHHGTYKVFVNFIGIADITFLHPRIYENIEKDAIDIAGIRYAPPNYLRMNMFLELSRPAGDVSRWEKVLKRLSLLNKYYPMNLGQKCETVDFQRQMHEKDSDSEKLYVLVRDSFIDQGVIFFGGYAAGLYARYMLPKQQRIAKTIPDFDVLSEEPEKCAMIVVELLKEADFKKVTTVSHEAIGEIIPAHVEIKVGRDTIAFIYKPIACHNYNSIMIADKQINVATIDTILSFYLAFVYVELPYYTKERLLCMATFLFDIEQHNRLEQKGLLKRFSVECYGKQPTMEDIRGEKAKKYRELSKNRTGKEFQEWFLKYSPEAIHGKSSKLGQKHGESAIKLDSKDWADTEIEEEEDEAETEKQKTMFSKTSAREKAEVPIGPGPGLNERALSVKPFREVKRHWYKRTQKKRGFWDRRSRRRGYLY